MKNIVAVLVVVTAWSNAVRADVAPDPLAAMGNVRVMKEKAPNTSMLREEVRVELFPSVAVVDATFVMAHDGPDQTLEVGFPGQGVVMQERWAVHTPLHAFKAWVNDAPVASLGVETEVKFKAGPKGEQTRRETWHVFVVPLVKGKQTTLRVRYGVVAQWHYGQSYSGGTVERDVVWYILHTGAAWKGPIGAGRIVVEAAEGVDPLSIETVNHAQPGPASKEKFQYYKLPAGAVRTAKGFEFTFKDLTPTQEHNLEIAYRADPKKRAITKYGVDEKAAAEKLKALMQ